MLSPSQERLLHRLCCIYRLMLMAYPFAFRREYGREMVVVFRTQARDVMRNEGGRGLLPLTLHVAWDWLDTTLQERTDMATRAHVRILAITAAMMSGLVLFMVAVGGLVLLLTFVVSAVTLLSVPVLWLTGKRWRAGQLLAGWGVYLAIYLTIATGLTLAGAVHAHARTVGEEVCADSGCFAVDKVERAAAGPGTSYTLYWHLSSNDKQLEKRFPGKGLELYMFDERGRKFALPDSTNLNPLDVTLPPGETVRQSMTFTVPADAHQLFLTAKYRQFTFQSLLPGELSLVPHRHAKMIQIQ
jgi:hypothetical protein